jgi:hypothetical protein
MEMADGRRVQDRMATNPAFRAEIEALLAKVKEASDWAEKHLGKRQRK